MFSIIEMVIVLAAAAILTVQGIRTDIAKQRSALLASEGQNEAVIADALGTWATDNYTALLAEYTSSGSSTLTPPTLDQLFTTGSLKQPHRNGPFWGGSYEIAVSMVPAGCSAASGNCHVSWVLYPSQPILKGGKADVAGASEIAQAGGNQFGFSRIQNASTISALNGAWTATNPLGNVAAALLVTDGPSTDGNSLYIRRDGSLTWTGDQNANGVSINNLKDVTATGTVQGATVTAANGAQTTTLVNDGAGNTNLSQNGALKVLKSGTSTYEPIYGGNVVSSGYVLPAAIALPGNSCSPNGAAGLNSDGSGQWNQCLRNVWTPMGGNWQLYATYVVANGSGVPAPVCSSGATPKILIAAQNFYVDTTAVVNFADVSGSGPWTVFIVDGNGTPVSGQGIASTYCAYY